MTTLYDMHPFQLESYLVLHFRTLEVVHEAVTIE